MEVVDEGAVVGDVVVGGVVVGGVVVGVVLVDVDGEVVCEFEHADSAEARVAAAL